MEKSIKKVLFCVVMFIVCIAFILDSPWTIPKIYQVHLSADEIAFSVRDSEYFKQFNPNTKVLTAKELAEGIIFRKLLEAELDARGIELNAEELKTVEISMNLYNQMIEESITGGTAYEQNKEVLEMLDDYIAYVGITREEYANLLKANDIYYWRKAALAEQMGGQNWLEAHIKNMRLQTEVIYD